MNTSSLPAMVAAFTFASISVVAAQEIVVKEKVETPSTVVGDVASVDPDASTIVLSSEGTTAPVKYVFTDDTEFVDAAGQALTHEALREGEPATLQYFRAGDKMVVLKVIIAPPIASQTTKTAVIQSAPVAVPQEKMAVEKSVVREPVAEKKVTKKKTAAKEPPKPEKKKVVTKAKKPKVVEEETTTKTTTSETR